MPTENQVVEDAAKGAASAALEYGEAKIKAFIVRFRRRELGFIEDENTIQIVKSQRKKPEWKLYRQYIYSPFS